MKDRWADSGQRTFGLIDSSAPEGPIICHPPWDLSVHPATAVLPQLWIIDHVRRHQTTLSSPVLQPYAHGDSLSHSHSHTHMRVPPDCNESSIMVSPSWNPCLSRHICVARDLADQAHFCTNHIIITGCHLYSMVFHFQNYVERGKNIFLFLFSLSFFSWNKLRTIKEMQHRPWIRCTFSSSIIFLPTLGPIFFQRQIKMRGLEKRRSPLSSTLCLFNQTTVMSTLSCKATVQLWGLELHLEY